MIGTSYSLRTKPLLDLCIKNVTVKQADKVKLLGVIIDSKMSWDHQINKVVSKMGQSLAVVRRSSTFLPKCLVPYVIQTVVLSHLDYCSVVWSNTSVGNVKKLQMVQNRAARLALNCAFRTSVAKMHEQLSWMWVNDRWLYTISNFIKSIIIVRSPFMFYKKLPFSKDVHRYQTRHAKAQSFALPKCKTNQSQRTVMFRAMNQWKKLPLCIKQQTSV